MPQTIYMRALAALTLFFTLAFFIAIPASHAQEANDFAVQEEAHDHDHSDHEGHEHEEAAASEAGQNPEMVEKFELAKKILKINPVQKDLDQEISALAAQVPANRRVLFKSIIDRSIKIDRLNTAAQLALVEVFTTQELEAMFDYYSSVEGQAIQDKMPAFEEKLAPVIRSMVEDAVFNIKNSNVDFSK